MRAIRKRFESERTKETEVAKKKPRMYYTSIQKDKYSIHSSGAIKSLMVTNAQNTQFYTWYNLSSARFLPDGALTMRCSGTGWVNEAEGTTMHWTGISTFKPDHPEYSKFCEAVKTAEEDMW